MDFMLPDLFVIGPGRRGLSIGLWKCTPPVIIQRITR